MAGTPKKAKPRTPQQRMASRRERLRAQGLRPIMTDKLNTLRHDRVKRIIGTLDSDACEKLNSALLLVLGLAR